MSSEGINRTQILRRDCPTCATKGYTETNGNQEMCPSCQGSGLLEKEVSYKFETAGRRTRDEIAAEFGVNVDDYKDEKHSTGD